MLERLRIKGTAISIKSTVLFFLSMSIVSGPLKSTVLSVIIVYIIIITTTTIIIIIIIILLLLQISFSLLVIR